MNKTISKIRQGYYWPGMCHDAKLWCMSCHPCRQKKGPGTRTRAPLRLYNVGVPWERVAVDLAGPFNQTHTGNKYLVVVMDYFTRWPEAIPVPDQTAATIARVLVDQVFSRFGAPAELHSDQGRMFEAELFRNVLEIMGIRKTRTIPGHPQSDGAVERLIRTVTQQLAIFARHNPTDWDLQVQLVMLSLRVAPHTTTGVSPAMMLFGRDLNLPPALARGPPPPRTQEGIPRAEYPAWLRDRLHHLHHAVRERADIVSLRMKERYDLRAKRPTFPVGSEVWLFDPRRRVGQSPKLRSWWDGPYQVQRVINDVVVAIRRNERCRTRVVHVGRLAPVVSRQPLVQ